MSLEVSLNFGKRILSSRCYISTLKTPLTFVLSLFISCVAPPLAYGLDGIETTRATSLTGRVVFSANVNGDQRIYSADIGTGKLTLLVNGPTNDWSPMLHPAGNQIVFESDREGPTALFTVSWDGGEVTKIVGGDSAVGNPDWHPDKKKKIVYYYREEGGPKQTNLYSFDLLSNKETKITSFTERNSTPKVSPDGHYIAFSTNRFWPGWDVCVYSLKTKSATCPLKGLESYCRPAWGLDGKSLYYSVGVENAISLGEYTFAGNQKNIRGALPGRTYDTVPLPKNELLFANNQTGSFDIYLQSESGVTPVLKAPFDLRSPSWHERSVMQQEILQLKSQKK